MYARVGKIPGNHVKQVLELLNEVEKEELKEMKGVYVLVDEKKEKLMTITLWESKEDLKASLPAAKEVFKEVEKITGWPVEVEHFEVALQQ
ncbi:MAG: hypothetical protein SCJ97_09315 [Bacillota bacterium]|nr:hypothetical protein [Bacillota bacterium]